MSTWDTEQSDQTWSDYEEVKPKWFWLITGYILTSTMLAFSFLFRSSGINAWAVYLGIWLLSLLTYLAPFALFAMKDFDLLAKNPNADAVGRRNLPLYRTTLLIFGFVVSMIFVYLAAEEISKNLNALT